MGKCFIYGVIILFALFILNWFGIVNIPWMDIPDFTGNKQEMTSKSHDAVKQVE
jgi:hypothetical protein